MIGGWFYSSILGGNQFQIIGHGTALAVGQMTWAASALWATLTDAGLTLRAGHLQGGGSYRVQEGGDVAVLLHECDGSRSQCGGSQTPVQADGDHRATWSLGQVAHEGVADGGVREQHVYHGDSRVVTLREIPCCDGVSSSSHQDQVSFQCDRQAQRGSYPRIVVDNQDPDGSARPVDITADRRDGRVATGRGHVLGPGVDFHERQCAGRPWGAESVKWGE